MPTSADVAFAELAISSGYVSPHQARECFDNQQAMADMGVKQPLAKIMVAKGYLTTDQLAKLEREYDELVGIQKALGPYQILEKIGEGGMGTVFKARASKTGAIVALKMLPPHLARDENFVKRFLREAKIAAQLNHPNIVAAIEAGSANKQHYFAMEYVEGETVQQRLDRDRLIPEGEALHIVRRVAFALQYAASMGLIHRDIKPDNIFLLPGGEVKLGDMGLAKSIDQDVTKLTKSKMVVGTPQYISPEQARGVEDLDIRCDIYSLGATLHHMITGEIPYEARSTFAMLNKHLHEEVPWPADINDDLTDDVCQLIQAMMAKDPADRYQTPLDLIYDLDLVIKGAAPSTAMLEIGKSAIRPAVRVRKAADAAERRRLRLEADARFAATLAIGNGLEQGTAQVPKHVFIVAGAFLAALCALALALWSRSSRAPEPPAPPKPDSGKRPPVVPDKPSMGPQQFAEIYRYASEFWKKNPRKYTESIANFATVRASARDTVWAMKARAAISQIEKARGDAGDAVLARMEDRASALVATHDYDRAMQVYAEVPAEFADVLVGRTQAGARAVATAAEQKIASVLAAAEECAAAGEPAEGLKKLGALAGVAYSPWAEKVGGITHSPAQSVR